MQIIDTLNAMPRSRKTLLGVFVAFLVYTITGFLVLPPIVKSVVSEKLSLALHRDTRITGVKINPYTLSARLTGLTVMDTDGKPLTAVDEIFINLQLSSLFKRALVLKAFHVNGPYFRIVRSKSDGFNFSDLIPENKVAQKENKESEAPKPFNFSIRDIRISDGTIEFLDNYKQTRHRLGDIAVSVPFVSSRPGDARVEITPSFSAKLNGTALSVTAKGTPFADSQKTEITLDVKKLDIPRYLPYAPMPEAVRVSSAFLDTTIRLSYERKNGKNPWLSVSGSTALSKFEVVEDSGDALLKLPAIQMVLKSAEPLTQMFHFSNIVVESPEVNISRLESGMLNLLKLTPKTDAAASAKTSPEKKTGSAKLPLVIVDHLKIGGGQILVSDQAQGRSFTASLNPFDLTVDHFSTRTDRQATFKLAATTGNKETIEGEGTFSVNPIQSEGVIALNGMILEKYAPYYHPYVQFDITEGKMDFKTGYRFQLAESEPAVNLFQTHFSLNALKLEDRSKHEAFFTLPRFSVDDTEADSLARTITVGNLSTEDGFLLCRRSKKGLLNLENLVVLPESSAESTPSEKKPSPSKPWQADLKNLVLKNYTVRFNDLQPPEPVDIMLDKITLTAENLSTKADVHGSTALSLRWNRQGELSISGPVAVRPLSADLKVEASNLDIRPVQPYITDVARIDITDGNVNARGRLNLSFTEKTGPKLRYQGKAAIRSMASVGKITGNDFVKWVALDFSGMDIRSHPVKIDIDQVALTGYYTQLVINPDGTINANRILRRDKPKETPVSGKSGTAEKNTKKPPLPEININTVTLQNGTIHFVDRFNKPNFETDLMELGGRISGISSDSASRADVSLKGMHQSSAPLEISGKMNPLIDSPFVDVKLSIRDIQLSPFSPYSGKYIGYIIEKGSLHVELAYTLENSKLHGENRIFVDQLTLGDKVESPDATSLPVRLGISLLQDRNDRIALDLPVDGDINNPDFNVGKAVFKIIGNLFAKVITAPFAAFGSMFGGGTELSFIEFDYGSTQIADTAKEKLDTLTTALYERPSVRLDITGGADPVMDRGALANVELKNRLMAEKLNKMSKKEREAISPDQITLSPEEYDRYLKKVYKDADFPKPRDEKGRIKKLPPEEMEKLIGTNIRITDDALRLLAQKRAFTVQEYILKSEKVTPERIFVLEPESFSSPKNADGVKSRVNFTLK